MVIVDSIVGVVKERKTELAMINLRGMIFSGEVIVKAHLQMVLEVCRYIALIILVLGT